jgi:hypothetical protein
MPVPNQCQELHQPHQDLLVGQRGDGGVQFRNGVLPFGRADRVEQIDVAVRQFGGQESQVFAPLLIAGGVLGLTGVPATVTARASVIVKERRNGFMGVIPVVLCGCARES